MTRSSSLRCLRTYARAGSYRLKRMAGSSRSGRDKSDEYRGPPPRGAPRCSYLQRFADRTTNSSGFSRPRISRDYVFSGLRQVVGSAYPASADTRSAPALRKALTAHARAVSESGPPASLAASARRLSASNPGPIALARIAGLACAQARVSLLVQTWALFAAAACACPPAGREAPGRVGPEPDPARISQGCGQASECASLAQHCEIIPPSDKPTRKSVSAPGQWRRQPAQPPPFPRQRRALGRYAPRRVPMP